MEELNNEYSRVERYFPEEKKQVKYIIPPESFSLHIIVIVLSRRRKKCLLHEELRIIERKITT